MGSIYFNVAALCIYVLNFHFYFSQSRLYLKQTNIFLLFMLTGICSTITNIISLVLSINKGAYSLATHYVAGIAYYLFQNTIPLFLCLFAFAFVSAKKTPKPWIKIIFFAPWKLSLLLSITTPIHHKFFYFDHSFRYTRGSLLPLLYAFAVFYVITGIVVFLKIKKQI